MKSIKYIYVLFILLLLPATTIFAYNGYDVQLKNANGLTMDLEFTLSDYSLNKIAIDNEEFTQIEFDNSVKTEKKGYAELPKIFAAVALADSSDVSAEILSTIHKDHTVSSPLLPSRGVLYRNQNLSEIPYEIDPASVIDAWYPENIAMVKDPFIFRDVRGISVYVHPFRYNAQKKSVRIYEKITVRLTQNTTASTNSLKRKTRTITHEMRSIYSDLFINFNDFSQRESLTIGEYGDILVLHTGRDAVPVESYVQWKRLKGFNVTTKEVKKGTNVKAIVKNAFGANANLLYVQLVGDWEDIQSDRMNGGAPMDPMLGCVVGTDDFPDLIIGRFSGDNPAQIFTQIKKAMDYEKRAELNGSWYKAALGIASGEGAGHGDDGEADYEHMDIIKKNRLLKTTYTTVHDIYKTGTPAMVSQNVNDGLSLINYVGHGSHTSWATSGFSNEDIENLTNGKKLPFVISVACVNGAFHTKTGDCFAESWLKKVGGGAVAAVMSTINQPWSPPMRGQDYMNDLIIGGYDYTNNPGSGTNVTEGRTTVGSIVFNGLVLMYAESAGPADLETIQTWTVFGDSALQLRTDTPKIILLSNTSVSSKEPFATTVSMGNSPQKDLMVTLEQNDTVFKGYTDINGAVTLEHTFTSGVVKLTVSGFNFETHHYHVNVDGGPGNQPPEANYEFDIYELDVTFKNTSFDPDGTIVSYLWDFGDGTTSTEKDPVKTFPKINLYTITLTVTDDMGLTNTLKQAIQVGQPAPWPYCPSTGKIMKNEWIADVNINGFSNPSEKEGYGDFTETVIDITKGIPVSVLLSPQWADKPYKEHFRIWIDLNKDKDFEDDGEMVFEGHVEMDEIADKCDDPCDVKGMFTVPTTAITGKTRMRVTMNYNLYPHMCGELSFGEVEDYTVNLQ